MINDNGGYHMRLLIVSYKLFYSKVFYTEQMLKLYNDICIYYGK